MDRYLCVVAGAGLGGLARFVVGTSVVGFLGGYTTFSSFEYETYQAVRDGARWVGLLNVAGSVLFGYLAVWLGAILTARR